MNEFQFVDTNKVETLEQYAASLITSMVSLKTLNEYHLTAYRKGLLVEDEVKLIETIHYYIDTLLRLYRSQVENILDRTGQKEEDILQEFKNVMPNVKIPKKRKYNNKKKENIE